MYGRSYGEMDGRIRTDRSVDEWPEGGMGGSVELRMDIAERRMDVKSR